MDAEAAKYIGAGLLVACWARPSAWQHLRQLPSAAIRVPPPPSQFGNLIFGLR